MPDKGMPYLVLAAVEVALDRAHLQPVDPLTLRRQAQLMSHVGLAVAPQQATSCRPQQVQRILLSLCIACISNTLRQGVAGKEPYEHRRWPD